MSAAYHLTMPFDPFEMIPLQLSVRIYRETKQNL